MLREIVNAPQHASGRTENSLSVTFGDQLLSMSTWQELHRHFVFANVDQTRYRKQPIERMQAQLLGSAALVGAVAHVPLDDMIAIELALVCIAMWQSVHNARSTVRPRSHQVVRQPLKLALQVLDDGGSKAHVILARRALQQHPYPPDRVAKPVVGSREFR